MYLLQLLFTRRKYTVVFLNFILVKVFGLLFWQAWELCGRNTSNSLFLFNRLRAIWPKGYQSWSLDKSHQNGDYLKTKAAGSIPAERQLFRIACFK